MGKYTTYAGLVATAIIFGNHHLLLGALSAFATVGHFWTHGLMHNQAVESAERRGSFSGGAPYITAEDVSSVSDALAKWNFIFAVGCAASVVTAIIQSIRVG